MKGGAQASEVQKAKRRVKPVRAIRRSTELEGSRAPTPPVPTRSPTPAGPLPPLSYAIASGAGTTASNRVRSAASLATGDLEQNWQGYFFVPGISLLRNRVGARTLGGLRDAENDLVEARVIEVRESLDVAGLRAACRGHRYAPCPPQILTFMSKMTYG
jgi:hypothetical protein